MHSISASILALIWPLFLMASLPKTHPSASVLFQDDLAALDANFASLTELENNLSTCRATFADLRAQENTHLRHLAPSGEHNFPSAILGVSELYGGPRNEQLRGIPGFLWGFCLGGLGVYLVHQNIENQYAQKQETRHAWVGFGFLVLLVGATFVLLKFADGLRP